MKRADVLKCLKRLERNGDLDPRDVVEAARDPASPLHSRFEWDDGAAAERYRLDQARALIREVRVTITSNKRQIESIAYVRNPDKNAHEPGYKSVLSIRSSKERARQVLIDELQRSESAMQRAYDVADALNLTKEVEGLLAHVRQVQSAA